MIDESSVEIESLKGVAVFVITNKFTYDGNNFFLTHNYVEDSGSCTTVGSPLGQLAPVLPSVTAGKQTQTHITKGKDS